MPFPRVRTRFTSDLKDGIRIRWTGNSEPDFDNFGSTWKSFRRYEYISDVVGSPKTQRVKPVDHVKARYTGLPYQTFNCDHGLQIVITDKDSLPRIDIEALLALDMFSIPHSERVKANQEAFNYFSDRFPAKISFSEFAQGLFELTALLPKIQASLSRTIAAGYLTKKFGWDNLISDIKQFISLVSSIRERMEFLKRTYGKPTKLHFKKELVPLGTVSYSENWSPARSWGVRLVLEDYFCDYSAGATLLQQLKHIDDAIGWLRGIVISLGLNNPLEATWKTLRLSFVVDWFINVSGSLHRLAAVQPAERWDVYDVWSSVKIYGIFKVVQYNEDVMDGPGNPERFLGYLTVTRYQRWVGLPLDLSLFTPSSLSPDQLVLLAAMTASK